MNKVYKYKQKERTEKNKLTLRLKNIKLNGIN